MSNRTLSQNIRGFSADFGEHTIFIDGGCYPIGSFAVDVMNIETSVINEIIEASKPVIDTYRRLQNGEIGFDDLSKAAHDILRLTKMITQVRPFSYFDSTRTIRHAELYSGSEFHSLFPKVNGGFDYNMIVSMSHQIKQRYNRELMYYASAANDLCVCRNIFIDFCDRILSVLARCDKPSLANAWREYAADRENMLSLMSSSGLDLSFDVFDNIHGFSSEVDISMKYTFIESSGACEGLCRTYSLKRLSSFLTVDFFEGLMAGHYPRRCEMCGRYFLMENAKRQKYCNGYYPGDEKRTCRTIAAKRQSRERSEDHPVKAVYRKRCNTVDHHLRSGAISEEKARIVKKLARDKKTRALRDNEYFLNEYEQEMSQEAIYAEADALMGKRCSS